MPVPTILCLLLSLFICIRGGHDQPFDYQAEAGWAVGDAPDFSCEIFHTRNGGATRTNQALPLVIPDGVKGIRGISRTEAWAVGLKGPVMHTVDGGNTWRVVPTTASSSLPMGVDSAYR